MTSIPGAEYAPILTRTVIDLGPEGSEYQLEREIRWRADVTDPDDMRAIWYRAARALGATEEEAERAFLVYSHNFDCWSLCVSRWATVYALWSGPQGHGPDQISHATGALCRAVWGPK